ncbi:transglycosylase domain-containing protein [Streptomyces sp. NPDC059718]
MSEHRRKPPQSPGDGRAAARRGAQQPPPPPGGRRAAGPPTPQPYGTHGTGSGQGHGPRQGTGQPPRQGAGTGAGGRAGTGGRSRGAEPPYQGRAAARRAAQATQKGGRRRGATDAQGGRGGGQPPKKRIIDYPRWGKDGWRRWMPSWKLASGLCLFFFGSLVAVAGVGYAMVGIPNENDAAKSQNNVFYWADGSRMVATGTGANRQNVTLSDIPKAMQNAVISAENKSFYEDSGVDPMGVGRALFNMAKGGDAQGGSTITQQYVKNTYLSQDQTVSRKFKELFISIKVGTKLEKPDILQGYLNTSYYGRSAYGIQAAAQTYYGRDADKLTPSQCAFLAALLKGPTYYDPAGAANIDSTATAKANRARSEDRWKWILGEMYKDGKLNKDEYTEAVSKYPMPQGLKATAGMSGQISYLVDTAKSYVLSHSDISQSQLDKGGYEIHTTFDKKKVESLKKAVDKVRTDNINPKKRDADKYVQFGAASVVPGDGKIVAIYGGEGYEHGQFNNNANTTGVPVGSTWKPFVLAAAMQYGTNQTDGVGLSPQSKYNGNDLLKIKDHEGNWVLKKDGSVFKQKNESGYPWGYISLRKAMEQSINTPFVQLGEDVGLPKVAEMAKNAGVLDSSFESLNASFSIGTSKPSAIRMADAYATFASSGTQAEPYSVTKVVADGKDVPGFGKPKIKRDAIDSNVADNVTDVLQNVVKNGTGQKALAVGRTVAGKTGTTDSEKGTRSAWFVGYTKQLSTSVVLFRENPKKPGLIGMAGTAGKDSAHGGEMPAEVWARYMTEALKGKDDSGFPDPGKIGEVKDQVGAPSPSPSVSASPTESATMNPTPTISQPPTTPTPTDSGNCKPWEWGCQDGGGGNNGGATDGGTGGTPSSTPSSSTTGKGNGGNGNGGLIAGPGG